MAESMLVSIVSSTRSSVGEEKERGGRAGSRQLRSRGDAARAVYGTIERSFLRMLAALAVATAALLMLRDRTDAVRVNSLQHLFLALIGGMLSGLVHVLILPLDLVKCRLQGGVVGDAREAVRHMCSEARGRAQRASITASNAWDGGGVAANLAAAVGVSSAWLGVFFFGWKPSLAGYILQGGLKFAVYEALKFRVSAFFSFDFVAAHSVAFFMLYSAVAEVIADVALAPFETVKVALQTAHAAGGGGDGNVGDGQMAGQDGAAAPGEPSPPTTAEEAFVAIYGRGDPAPAADTTNTGLGARVGRWRREAATWRPFFACLAPLMLRQVPMTMIKFALFERAVDYFYHSLVAVSVIQSGAAADASLAAAAAATPPFSGASAGVKLVVVLLAGFVSGFLCAVVSCPADTLVSRMAIGASRPPTSMLQLTLSLGFSGLFSGLGARICMVGSYSAVQWIIYEAFKLAVGLPATGATATSR